MESKESIKSFVDSNVSEILSHGETAAQELSIWICDCLEKQEALAADNTRQAGEILKLRNDLRIAVSEGHTARERFANAQARMAELNAENTNFRRMFTESKKGASNVVNF